MHAFPTHFYINYNYSLSTVCNSIYPTFCPTYFLPSGPCSIMYPSCLEFPLRFQTRFISERWRNYIPDELALMCRIIRTTATTTIDLVHISLTSSNHLKLDLLEFPDMYNKIQVGAMISNGDEAFSGELRLTMAVRMY